MTLLDQINGRPVKRSRNKEIITVATVGNNESMREKRANEIIGTSKLSVGLLNQNLSFDQSLKKGLKKKKRKRFFNIGEAYADQSLLEQSKSPNGIV